MTILNHLMIAEKKIVLSSYLYSNVKVSSFNYFFNLNKKKSKFDKSNKILIKNFIYFICLINYFLKKKKIFNSISFFVPPKEVKKLTLIRAPFRHKLSKKNYVLIRYKFILRLTLALDNTISINNMFQLKHIIYRLLKFIK